MTRMTKMRYRLPGIYKRRGVAREGSYMVPWPSDGKALPRNGGEKSLDCQFEIVAKAFLELFELLEEY